MVFDDTLLRLPADRVQRRFDQLGREHLERLERLAPNLPMINDESKMSGYSKSDEQTPMHHTPCRWDGPSSGMGGWFEL